MLDTILIATCLGFGLVAALLAGVFQSFSDFVVRALSQTPDDAGMASMKRINVTVMRSWFLAGFMALAPASIVLAIAAQSLGATAALAPLVAASILYCVLGFGVTIFGNVPMNNRLAELPVGGAEGRQYWQAYTRRWTRLNTLRMAACIGTAICYFYAAIIIASAGS